jgi:hypothetical protein
MMFKRFSAIVLTLGVATPGLAQNSFDQQSAKLSTANKKPVAQNVAKTSFAAASDLTFNTLAFNGGVSDGYRTNFTVVTPKLIAYLPNDVTGHLALPLFYITDQSNKSAREIGRPEVGISQSTSAIQNLKLDYDLDIRLPLADTSYGYAESARVWGIYTGYNAKLNLSDSNLHLVQLAKAGYNTGYTQTNGSSYTDSQGVTSTYAATSKTDTPVILMAGVGAGLDLSKASVDLTLNIANGIGNGHSNTSSTYTYQTASQSNTYLFDRSPADLSNLKLSGSFEIANDTQLTSYVVKALKDVNDHGADGLAIEDLQTFASVGVGVGISKRF